MRAARDLIMLTAITLMAVALAAPSAFAQTVELEDEDIGGHCSAVTNVGTHGVEGGCEIHLAGSWVIAQHTGTQEAPVSQCNLEFTIRIGEDGFGYIIDRFLSGASCGITPCDEAAPSHAERLWPLIIFEGETESGDNDEGLATTLCYRPSGASEGASGTFCTLTFDLYTDPATDHPTELEAETLDDLPAVPEGESCVENPAIEFSGHWTVEDTDAVVHHASSAGVEVEDATGAHCPTVTQVGAHRAAGGCVLHTVGETVFAQHLGVTETAFAACILEFTLRVDEDGSGYIVDQIPISVPGSSLPCGISVCDEAAPSHAELRWPSMIFEGQTESGDSTEGLTSALCLRGGTTEGAAGVQCTLTLDMYADAGGHPDEFEAETLDGFPPAVLEGEACAENPAIEVSGHWQTEETTSAVVHHTP